MSYVKIANQVYFIYCQMLHNLFMQCRLIITHELLQMVAFVNDKVMNLSNTVIKK